MNFLANEESVNDPNLMERFLIADLQRVAQIARILGYPCRPYSQTGLKNFRLLSSDKQNQIVKFIRRLLNIIVRAAATNHQTPSYRGQEFVEQAVVLYGLELRSGPEFWQKIQKDDVIEVYNSENIQLFRTFNFFRISSYSLLDLLTLEWFLLWEKPSYVMKSMLQISQDMMNGKIHDPRQIEVPKHILKEIYRDTSVGFKGSTILVEPGIICPLFKEGTNQVGGFLFSLRGTVLGYDAEVKRIALI